MKTDFTIMALALNRALAALPHAAKSAHSWKPPGDGDGRGPCPMLNSLANHGYLPHDGKDITENITIQALGEALNMDAELSQFLFRVAITANPTENATTFSLKDLVRHNILEHDASLSRVDYYFGNPQPFNQTVFDQTRSHWTDSVINVQMAANARYARVQDSNATNPNFTLSEFAEIVGYGESAAYIVTLGDKTAGTVQKSWVEYLFENERLPIEVGWTRRKSTITTSDLDSMTQWIKTVTPGASTNATTAAAKRGTMHNARLQVVF